MRVKIMSKFQNLGKLKILEEIEKKIEIFAEIRKNRNFSKGRTLKCKFENIFLDLKNAN